MGLLRFELKSMAPEATRMPSYPTGPGLQIKNRNCIEDIFGKIYNYLFKIFKKLTKFSVFIQKDIYRVSEGIFCA